MIYFSEMLQKIKKYLILFILLILAGWIVASIRFVILNHSPIKEIKLETTPIHVSKSFIDDCIRVRDRIFFVSLNKIRNCLLEHPFAKTVAVKRDAPTTLVLKIIEKTPIGLFDKGQGVFFPISSDGTLINQNSKLPLIVIKGEKSIENYPDIFKTIKLFPEIFKRLRSATYMGQRRWRLHIDKIGIIDLSENLKVSLERANKELSSLQNPFEKILDLRDDVRIFITE